MSGPSIVSLTSLQLIDTLGSSWTSIHSGQKGEVTILHKPLMNADMLWDIALLAGCDCLTKQNPAHSEGPMSKGLVAQLVLWTAIYVLYIM